MPVTMNTCKITTFTVVNAIETIVNFIANSRLSVTSTAILQKCLALKKHLEKKQIETRKRLKKQLKDKQKCYLNHSNQLHTYIYLLFGFLKIYLINQ